MLTSPGTDLQRAFLEKGFLSASGFASLAEANTAEHYSPTGTQLFQWLYGTEGLDRMRISVSSMFSA